MTSMERRQAQATDGLVASQAETKALPCQRDDDSRGAEHDIQIPYLPEDIWRHIHSLMRMRNAAQAVCVSHAYPNLIFCGTTLGMKKEAYGNDEIATDFSSEVDHILKKHSGIGIEELSLVLPVMRKRYNFPPYNFPCSLLSNGSGNSIRFLKLGGCSLRPTAELPWLKGLTKLQLIFVCFTGDELGCLLCNSFALERLVIRYCGEVVCLKIPCMLRRLRHLEVISCGSLQVIDNKAPNISSFFYAGARHHTQLSLGEASKMEYIHLIFLGALHYACVALPSSMANLKIANIRSSREMANMPMLHSKFLHLKKLSIALSAWTFTPAYDYFSLVSFLDACPSLETLVLDATQEEMMHVSVFTDPSDLRKMQGHPHHKMKIVKILGFTSARSLVELTCHFLESITSLERLMLESYKSVARCFVGAHNSRKCSALAVDILREAQRGLLAIRTYIEPKVPSMVKLSVVEPCRRCHTVVEL